MTTVCITPLSLGYPQGGAPLVLPELGAAAARGRCRVIWLEDIGEHAATNPRALVESHIATLSAGSRRTAWTTHSR